MNQLVKHGWYSIEQSKVAGVAIYTTPRGGVVRITQVTDTLDQFSKWDDIIYVGEVLEFVKRISKGEIWYHLLWG